MNTDQSLSSRILSPAEGAV